MAAFPSVLLKSFWLKTNGEVLRKQHRKFDVVFDEANQERIRLDRRLGEVEREIKRAVDAITKGAPPEPLIARMHELETEPISLGARLDAAKEADNVVALHPKAFDAYNRDVMELAKELKEAAPISAGTYSPASSTS